MPGGIDPHTHMQLPFMGTVAADDRISFRELVDALQGADEEDPSDNLAGLISGPTLTGGGSLAFDVSMTPALEGLDLGANPKIVLTVNSWGNPFAATPVAPNITFTYPDLGELLDFGNLDLSFASIVDGLQALSGFLSQFEAFDFLSDPLPIIDLSINDLISVADKFAAAVDEAQSNPAGTVQLLPGEAEAAIAEAAPLRMVPHAMSMMAIFGVKPLMTLRLVRS